MKQNEVSAALRQFAKEHLSPTPSERAFVSRVYEALQAVLGSRNCLQIGSYPRFTAVTPIHDLDVLYIIGRQEKDQSSASRALDTLEALPRTSFDNPTPHTLEISRQTHSISISFMGDHEEVFAVDVVPAYISGTNEFGDDTYLVPEIFSKSHRAKMLRYKELTYCRQPMTWINSDPRGYIEIARQMNEANGDFRKSVKLAKSWKQACCDTNEDFKLKSFHLEQAITIHFRRRAALDIFDAIFWFFHELPELISRPQIPDRADPQRMIDAYVSDLTPAERQAILQAREGFLIKLESLAEANGIHSLIEPAFHERLDASEAYLFDQGIPVLTEDDAVLRIQGNVLARDGFRPFVLDARGLISVGRQIQFSVIKPVAADFYKWKVKNDDSSPQRRGEITDHSTAGNPERTAFPGKHYVECYAIRRGICIARARQNVEVR